MRMGSLRGFATAALPFTFFAFFAFLPFTLALAASLAICYFFAASVALARAAFSLAAFSLASFAFSLADFCSTKRAP